MLEEMNKGDSIQAITHSVMMGQKLAAVALEYKGDVKASELTKNPFSVKDLYYDTSDKEATYDKVIYSFENE